MSSATTDRPAHRYLERCRAEPDWWMEETLGLELWSKQRDIVCSVRDNQKTSVRSCHGPGKTCIAAAIGLWFLYSWREATVVTTATTWKQIETILWREVKRLKLGSQKALGGRLLQSELKLPDGRHMFGLSTAPDQQESFQGLHSPHILLVVDEASGVPMYVWEQAESYMSTGQARLLAIGNPTQNTGEFYASHHSKRAEYNTIHISAYDTPAFTGERVSEGLMGRLVQREWVEQRAKVWGEDSQPYQVRVLGEFYKGTDDTVISLSVAEAAQQREISDEHIHPVEAPNRIACDVARFGSDETVIMHRHGKRVRQLASYVGKDLMDTVGRIIEAKQKTGAREIVVDDAGVGGGVTDRLREQGHSVVAHNGGEKALDEEGYVNARTEVWFNLADELLDADIPTDDLLMADLVAPIYKFDSRGRRVLEPKEQTKKRLGRSPDRGDTLAMCFAPARSSVLEVW